MTSTVQEWKRTRIKGHDGKDFVNGVLSESGTMKVLESPEYNYIFDKVSGHFLRWGRTQQDDPQMCPFGNEILDLEISAGECSGRCPWCYKRNGENGGRADNMTLAQFKTILSKMPKILTQIAYGLCDVDTNSDFVPMMEHARANGIIPNYTCNGHRITKDWAKITAELCGAVAVSIVDKEQSYDAIHKFTEAGMNQCNIHAVLSVESYERVKSIVLDITKDPRLARLNAIVFLQYKHKNPDSPFHSMLNKDKYRELVDLCEQHEISYGMDSCSCGIFLDSIKGHKDYKKFETVSEPCESTCASAYINHRGEFYPCSFCEGMDDWSKGIDVLKSDDFLWNVWHSEKTVAFRERLLKNNRNCPIYKI